MTTVTNGNHPGKATISFLPILDMDSSDLTCIYSVLVFILKQAEQIQVKTPVVTFDQPLWLKAMEIVKAKSVCHIISYPFSYEGKASDTLTTLCHAKFMENVASCSALDPGRLPPSKRAAHFHALRVHLQVSQWKYLDLKCLKPKEWGWVFHRNTLIPAKLTFSQPHLISLSTFTASARCPQKIPVALRHALVGRVDSVVF